MPLRTYVMDRIVWGKTIQKLQMSAQKVSVILYLMDDLIEMFEIWSDG